MYDMQNSMRTKKTRRQMNDIAEFFLLITIFIDNPGSQSRAETWCDDWGARKFFFTSPPKVRFFLGGRDAWFCTDIEQI